MHRMSDIAADIGGTLVGDGDLVIARATEPSLAGPHDLAVALSGAFLAQLADSQARAAVLLDGTDWQDLDIDVAVLVPRGRLAMAKLTQVMNDAFDKTASHHPTAVVDATAQIADGVALGAFCTVGAGVIIGKGSTIGAYVSLASGTQLGQDCRIADRVSILANCQIGDRVVIHPGAVIGADGFSFVTAQPAHVEIARSSLGVGPAPVLDDPRWHKIHSLGGVHIGDDVEIGANSAVDAGTLRATKIGTGTKLDNFVHVGHNAIVGEHCLLCGQVGVAGSAIIGDRSVLGGQSGVADNTNVGSDVVIGGASAVLSNVPNGRVMLGYPAMKLTTHVETYKALRRLPRMMSRMLAAKTGSQTPDE